MLRNHAQNNNNDRNGRLYDHIWQMMTAAKNCVFTLHLNLPSPEWEQCTGETFWAAGELFTKSITIKTIWEILKYCSIKTIWEILKYYTIKTIWEILKYCSIKTPKSEIPGKNWHWNVFRWQCSAQRRANLPADSSITSSSRVQVRKHSNSSSGEKKTFKRFSAQKRNDRQACEYVHEKMSKKWENMWNVESSGKWESDTDLKATCKKDKVEILEYCKKVTSN